MHCLYGVSSAPHAKWDAQRDACTAHIDPACPYRSGVLSLFVCANLTVTGGFPAMPNLSA